MFVKIFNRYLLSNFLSRFLKLFLLLYGIFFIMDLFFGHEWNIQGMGAIGVKRIIEFFFLYTFRILDPILAILLLLCAVWTITDLNKNAKLVALLTMGIEPKKILMPINVGVILVSLCFFAVREFYVPQKACYLSLQRDEFVQHPSLFDVKQTTDDSSRVSFDGEKIDIHEKQIINPIVSFQKDEMSEVVTIRADSAFFCEAGSNRPTGWLLKGRTSVSSDLENSFISDESRPNAKQSVLLSSQESWLSEGEIFVVSEITPSLLVCGDQWFSNGSLGEFLRIKKSKSLQHAVIRLNIYFCKRVFRILLDCILYFVAIPIMFYHLDTSLRPLKALVLVSIGLGFQLFLFHLGISLGYSYISVMFPLLFFLPIAFYCYDKLDGLKR